jgi:hypothetical protein
LRTLLPPTPLIILNLATICIAFDHTVKNTYSPGVGDGTGEGAGPSVFSAGKWPATCAVFAWCAAGAIFAWCGTGVLFEWCEAGAIFAWCGAGVFAWCGAGALFAWTGAVAFFAGAGACATGFSAVEGAGAVTSLGAGTGASCIKINHSGSAQGAVRP